VIKSGDIRYEFVRGGYALNFFILLKVASGAGLESCGKE
jgi:hypothetical protein